MYSTARVYSSRRGYFEEKEERIRAEHKAEIKRLKSMNRIGVALAFVMGVGTAGLVYVIFMFPPSPFYVGANWYW